MLFSRTRLSFLLGDALRHRPILYLTEGFFMKPNITVLTLGVSDLERALIFYRDGLGFKTDGIIGKEFEYGAVVFLELQPGLKLALWPNTSIEHDTGLSLREDNSTNSIIGYNVSSQEEVDAVMEQAWKAGATIIKSARNTFYGGYAGYFRDLDGHLWDVVYNPQMLPVSYA